MALRDDKRDSYGYGHCHNRGVAATGLALGASGLGIAIFGGLAIAYGLNAASKARAAGNQNAINQQQQSNAQLFNLLANRAIADGQRADNITLDVQQTLRNLAGATATGGSASALATAEALALLQNNNSNPLSSVIQNSCALRVQRVSTQDCGCGCNG